MDIKRNEAQNIVKKILSAEKLHFRNTNILYSTHIFIYNINIII